ncbi:MAG: phospholipase D-like domain-containing protein [Bacteroidota bacterium]
MMWFNQAKCDIYMGTGAGKKLLHEIRNAQKSVKISSHYLSPKLFRELMHLHKREVEVSLITSDTLDGGNGRQERSLRPLIVQHQHLDEKGNVQRNRWKTLGRVLILTTISVFILLPLLFYTTKNLAYLYMLPIPIVLYFAFRWVKRIVDKKRIYSYSYSSLFPFKVYIAPDANHINDMFIHGKIYIIDGHTAYLGSLNFTESGTKYNYETRVRITDVEAVQKIDAEFEELYNHESLAFIGIEEWGSYLYPEPIN